jgi:preprotein translocase subunit SecD
VRRYGLILALIAALMGGVVALALTREEGPKPNLGLDLQGGLEVVLEAQPPAGSELTESDLDRSVETMRERVDRLGVSEPEIRKQGSDQIVIQLAGVQDPARAAEIIGKTAQLQFYDLEGDLTAPSVSPIGEPLPRSRLYPLLQSEEAASKDGPPSAWYLYRTQDRSRVAGPVPTKEQLLEEYGGEVPEGRRHRVATDEDVLLPVRVPADERGGPDSRDDGGRSRARRHAAGLRPADRRAHRAHAVHGRGRGQVPRNHP